MNPFFSCIWPMNCRVTCFAKCCVCMFMLVKGWIQQDRDPQRVVHDRWWQQNQTGRTAWLNWPVKDNVSIWYCWWVCLWVCCVHVCTCTCVCVYVCVSALACMNSMWLCVCVLGRGEAFPLPLPPPIFPLPQHTHNHTCIHTYRHNHVHSPLGETII